MISTVYILISYHSRTPVYLLATLLSFQDFGHLYSHSSELFSRKSSYLLFLCLCWWIFIIYLHQLHISLPFHFVSIAVFWVSFLQAGGLWLHCVVETALCGWDGTSDLSRFNASVNLCLCSGRWICNSSL